MLLSMLTVGAQLLIPLVAIIFSMSIPIIAIYLYYRHKANVMEERKLMIEKGMVPPDINAHMEESRKRSPMSKGIDMLAVALGIITGYFAAENWHTSTPITILCAILLFLGIANIVKAFLFKNEMDSYE